jgi:hypothetical protein
MATAMSAGLDLSRHATIGCAQRGLCPDDLELALELGTRTPDGIHVRRADVDVEIAALKRRIDWITRLAGVFVAAPDNTVVTVYRPRPGRRRERRILRDQAHGGSASR